MKKKNGKRCILTAAAAGLAAAMISGAWAPAEVMAAGNVLISEIASSGPDWVEIENFGDEAVDISGWIMRDSDASHTCTIPDGTVLQPGEVLVLEENTDFDFGLGKKDSVNLYDKDQNAVDSYSWTKHADGTWQRIDGQFEDLPATKGTVNQQSQTETETESASETETATDMETSDSSESQSASETDAASYGQKPTAQTLVINEINSSPDDWIELYNKGTETLDLSGCEIRDNSDDHRWKLSSGTTLEAGGFLLIDSSSEGLAYDKKTKTFESGSVFDIGLGSGDSVRLYGADGAMLDSYTWTEHASYKGDAANASYGRYPDGTGSFGLMPETPGAANTQLPPSVVINEVNSSGTDWVELANTSDTEIDISGYEFRDNKDKKSHRYKIPEGTKIPANGFLVFDHFPIGLGNPDCVRLFDPAGTLISKAEWGNEHVLPSLGLYPDVNGSEYRQTLDATPGTANVFPAETETVAWPCEPEDEGTSVIDNDPFFLSDSSGLDFYNGQLYAVDNGTGRIWLMDVKKDGTMTPAAGFENGKRVQFRKDAGNADAAGPDAEGITAASNGYVYLAAERDNSNKGVNYNTILKADPSAPGPDITAAAEWNLTDLLPSVSANMGIEAVEWVPDSEIAGKFIDQNTGEPYDPAKYPNAEAGGVFFVALEDNGHVYAFSLAADGGQAVLLADIDAGLGGAMSLDYDTYDHVLWVGTDNGYGNKTARIAFNGTDTPDIVFVAPPSGVDTTANNEGMAIADETYTINGKRPVYRFQDGVSSGALTLGWISCDYLQDGSGSVTIGDWTYGQTASTPTAVSDTNGTDNVTFLYKAADADDSTYSAQVPTKAGNYIVKAVFKAKGSYKEAEALAAFTIYKAGVNAPAQPDDLPYNGSLQKAAVSDDPDGLYKVIRNDGGTEAGTYSVTVALTDPADYVWADTGDSADRELFYSIVQQEAGNENKNEDIQKADSVTKSTSVVTKSTTAGKGRTSAAATQVRTDKPQTGDSSTPALWLILVIGSLGFIISAIRFFRKVHQHSAE